MSKIIDYYADFCASKECIGKEIVTIEKIRTICGCKVTTQTVRDNICLYPDKKKAPLESPFKEQIGNQKIKQCKIEIEAEDKFHSTYPDHTQVKCRIFLNKILLCEFQKPWQTQRKTLTYEFIPEQKFASFFDKPNAFIECELMVGIEPICPKNLLMLITLV